MKKLLIILPLLLLIACGGQQAQPTEYPPLKPLEGKPPSGYATTMDGHTIAYQLYNNPGKPAVILVHMLRRTRSDWNEVATWLQDKGFAVITFDLRGHGQSSSDIDTLSAADYNNMHNDIAAVKSVLEANNADTSRLSIVGASIGANIALNYAAKDDDVVTAVLLSPGLEYRGIKTSTVTTGKPLLLVASNDDAYSAESSQTIADNNPRTELKLYENAGHGTNMFIKSDLVPTIYDWLVEHSS